VATDEFASDWTVSEVLRRVPAATMGFIRLRTACVGCALARFCTLDDVAAVYELPLSDLQDALAEAVRAARADAPPITPGGVSPTTEPPATSERRAP
jgi:hypothetical protein